MTRSASFPTPGSLIQSSDSTSELDNLIPNNRNVQPSGLSDSDLAASPDSLAEKVVAGLQQHLAASVSHQNLCLAVQSVDSKLMLMGTRLDTLKELAEQSVVANQPLHSLSDAARAHRERLEEVAMVIRRTEEQVNLLSATPPSGSVLPSSVVPFRSEVRAML